MYQLACILICLTPFSDSYEKLLLMPHFCYLPLILKSILSFSFNHLFTFSNCHTEEEVIYKNLNSKSLVPLIPIMQQKPRRVRTNLFTKTGMFCTNFSLFDTLTALAQLSEVFTKRRVRFTNQTILTHPPHNLPVSFQKPKFATYYYCVYISTMKTVQFQLETFLGLEMYSFKCYAFAMV